MTRILVVDDDRPLLRALRITLTARGYEVTTAADGAGALTAATQMVPDLVIVDLGLPDMDGVTVVQGLRGWLAAPIIVLSARHAEQAKINALDAGADDYVTKPFGMGELQARIRAALRRATPGDEQPVITTTAFTVDLAAKRVTTAGADEIRLTPPNGTCWKSLPGTPANSSATGTYSARSGAPGSKPRPATSASTWQTYDANSNPTPPGPATYSPTQDWATGSSPTNDPIPQPTSKAFRKHREGRVPRKDRAPAPTHTAHVTASAGLPREARISTAHTEAIRSP